MKIEFVKNLIIHHFKYILLILFISLFCFFTSEPDLRANRLQANARNSFVSGAEMHVFNSHNVGSGVLYVQQYLFISQIYNTYEGWRTNVTHSLSYFFLPVSISSVFLKPFFVGLLIIVIIILISYLAIIHIRQLGYRKELYKLLDGLQKLSGARKESVEKQGPYKFSKLVNILNTSLNQVETTFFELEKSVEIRRSEIDKQNLKLREKQKETAQQNLELKSAYEALLESRKRYEQLIENLQEEYIFFSQSPAGDLLLVSPSVKTILGYSVNEYRKKLNTIYSGNSLNDAARKHKENSLKGIRQPKYLVELFDKSGISHVLEITEFPVFNENNEFTSVEGIARDVTKGIRAEDMIQEKEEKYKLLFNKASDFVFFYNIENGSIPGKFIEVNEYTVKRLGYSHEELLEMTLNNLTEVEIWDTEPTIDEFTGNKKYEQIWTSKEGEIINVEIISHAFKLKNKEVGIAIARDITERKRVEEEIRYFNEELVNQKENLEALVDNLTQTQEQLVHSEKMAALGQLIAGVAHEINTPLGAIKASIGNLHDSLDKALAELPMFLENQSTESLKLFNQVLLLSSDQSDSLTSREKRRIRKELEKQLESEGVESFVNIADMLIYLNIHKEINDLMPMLKTPDVFDILQSARNFVSILKNSNTISLATDKAAKVVFALKKYAHRDLVEEKIPADVLDGLETVLTLYHNQLKHGVEVIKNYETLPIINCYPDDLNQVWTNLIHNSIQAMDQKGILTITAKHGDQYIFVSFADNGCGIEPDIQDKIFDPFFTTKKQGEGSGLGLDIVKKIVEKHGGIVTFTSELGKGTVFTVKLPVN